jgi:hypothetical protein
VAQQIVGKEEVCSYLIKKTTNKHTHHQTTPKHTQKKKKRKFAKKNRQI